MKRCLGLALLRISLQPGETGSGGNKIKFCLLKKKDVLALKRYLFLDLYFLKSGTIFSIVCTKSLAYFIISLINAFSVRKQSSKLFCLLIMTNLQYVNLMLLNNPV